MSTKQTPKSCSCSQCKRGKSSRYGKKMMQHDERAFRHNQKIALSKEQEVQVAHVGNYYD